MESSDGDKQTTTDATQSVLGLDCDEDTLSERESVGARRGPELANGGGNEAPSSSSSAGSKRKRNNLGSNQVELNGPGVSSSTSDDSTWSVDGMDDHHPFALSKNKDDHSDRSVTSAGAAVVRQPRGVLRLRKLAQNASTGSWTGSRDIPLSNGVSRSTQPLRIMRSKSNALKENRVGGDDLVSFLKTENDSHDQDSSTNFCPETEFSVEKKAHLSDEASKAVNVDKDGEGCRHVNGNDDVNLEENAARMLCSLSDNRCAGPAQKNTNLRDRSSKRSFLQHSNYFKNLCKEDKDVAGPSRLLRKRDDKVPFRKRRQRRHFYEVSPHDVDPFGIVKERIRVFWPLDETWYFGLVKEYDPVTRLHHVRYDDKDEEWINLQNERIKLLLLPGEVRSRSSRNNSRSVFKLKHEEKEREYSDENNTRSSESEPISCWSPHPKHGTCATSSNISKQGEAHSNTAPLFGQKQCQEPDVKRDKMFSDYIRDSSPANKGADVLNNVRKTPENTRFRFVYSRKRLCRKRNGFLNISEQDYYPKIVSSSAMVLPMLPGRVSDRADASLTYVSLVLNLPLKPVYKFICEVCSTWLSDAFLLQYGTLVVIWPVVHLDILFIDSVLGLKHLLLDTCLRSAVSLFCFLVRSFNQCLGQSFLKDSKIPCSSIRFQISRVHGKSQIVFMVLSFAVMGGSKLKQLLEKLQDHCSTRVLSNGNSKHTNIMHLTNGTDQGVLPSIDLFSKAVDLWDSQFLGESIFSDAHPLICYFSEHCEFAQNDLDMAAAPSILLRHHLKLLTEGNLTNGSQQSISFTSEQDKQKSGEQRTSVTFNPSRPTSRICPLNLSSSDDLLDLGTALGKNLSSSGIREFDTAETTLTSECNGSSFGDANPTCGKFPEQNGPYFGTEKPCSSNLSVICSSQVSEGKRLSIKIPQHKTADASNDKSLNKDENVMHPTYNLIQELNESPIGRSTPTAPRTTYHRNRFTSISRTFGDGSKLLPEELTLISRTGGSKRPRSQVSYSSPRSEELGLQPKSHPRKIQSHGTTKANDAKRFSDNSSSGHSSPESLTCVANVLVTVGDRGWREYDTQITMDSDGQSKWRICVKLAEGIKYAHKVCQVLQPGATNRYTHAMIWKGGAEWCLEFPDRSQWSIFKQMHDECYSHNIRAASVKNIPIPGVCLVDDDDNAAVSFVRSQDYLGHIGTDAEIALDDSRVIYDMDSDDESWISNWESLEESTTAQNLTGDLFERVMDKLEKFAYSHNCIDLTIDQMKELNIDNVSLDIIKGIHAYWKDKRQKKGMPLIRHFQSAMWKIYEQRLHDWESTVYKMQGSNGYQEKKLPPKPALFAFCLRPRGLQIPNKGPKQRSHKKLMSLGCHSFSREQEGFYRAVSGRRCNEYAGDGRTCELYDSGSFYSPTGYSPRFSMRTDSPRSLDASERSLTPRYFRTNSSKRNASFAFSEDHQPSPSFRHQKLKRGAPDHWNNAIQEWQNTKHLLLGASPSHHVDIEELKLRDATSAAQHTATMAKLKREKSRCLMHKADLALHKATVALMIADAIKSSQDGRRDFRDDER